MKRLGLVLGAMLMASKAFAWGVVGHELINELAIRYLGAEAPAFLSQNVTVLEKMSTVPDRGWRSGSTRIAEGPLHFFQWDVYQETDLAAVLPVSYEEAADIISAGVLDENGKTIWRSGQLYRLLREAISRGHCNQILQVAGTLGHYFADLSQPMHVSADYDGQSIGKPGIHSHFETKLIAAMDRVNLGNAVMQELKAGIPGLKLKGRSEIDVVALALAEAKISLQKLPRLISIYSQGVLGEPDQIALLNKEIPPALARGVYALAQVWREAFAGKGQQIAACTGTQASVPDPAWISFP